MPPQPHDRFKILTIALLILVLVFSIATFISSNVEPYDSEFSSDESSESCNVHAINLHGEIATYLPEVTESDSYLNYDMASSEVVASFIEGTNEDPDIKVILIEVDSYGGSPVAGEEIAEAVKASAKPVVAYIREAGASAAYWAVAPADRIFASKNSDVGSIGVTMSYLDNVAQNESEGLSFVQLSSGKYKDAGSPDKTLTKEEQAIFERDLKIIHEYFIQEVSTSRKIPIEKVRAIADGSTFLGAQAKELGLIDDIGGYNEAKTYIEGLIEEDAEVCW